MAGVALDLQLPMNLVNALPHAGEAETWSGALAHRIKTFAVVTDREFQAAVQGPNGDLHGARPGMTSGILQRLLRDAEKAKCHVARWLFVNFLSRHFDPSGPQLRKPLAFRIQGFNQSKVFEN